MKQFEPLIGEWHDEGGVKRLYLTSVEGSTWRIWRHPDEDWNGPAGPRL